MQESISTAQCHLKRGESLLKEALEENEVLDMDALFTAMDQLRGVSSRVISRKERERNRGIITN